MSIVFNGSTQYAHRTEAMPATYQFVVWFRRDTDLGITETIGGVAGGNSSALSGVQIEIAANDNVRLEYQRGGAVVLSAEVVGDFHFAYGQYAGESTPGSSGDGEAEAAILEDGETAFNTAQQITGLSNVAATALVLAALREDTGVQFAAITMSGFLMWSGNPRTVGELLAQREYRHAQQRDGLWGEYTFDDDEDLGADTSGNGRHLTLVGTPTHTTDEPDAILGDDPAGGPTVTSIDPDEGSESGGTVVTATGTGFVDGCTVTVGGAAATGVTFNSATEIEFTTPAGTVGAQDVVVENPDEQADTLVGGFTYLADPEIVFSEAVVFDADETLAAVGFTGQFLGTLEITGVGLADDGTMYAANIASDEIATAEVQSDGSFEFTGLDAGTYRIWGEVVVGAEVFTTQARIVSVL